ncbi:MULTISPECIES: response regulator [unclassified Sphingomonas]|uniref:response regulator n=1 Tax=unclassified Sphingomonas TaxID=196159 RepID=UPI000450C28A|nr:MULTISPECIES: response regulator [unclassified Sphingomonas]EZP48888.1 Response regulator receiver [Sphingomonas sp. RIT328]
MLFGRKKRSIVRVLVVEDEPLIAFDTEHLLSDASYQIVATVDRVAEAIAVLRSDSDVDLVLLDVNLADGSGLDVARAAGERGVAVLFVTGNFPAEAMALAAGCLAKPYQQRDLIGAIEAIEANIAGRKTRRLPTGFRLFAIPDAAPVAPGPEIDAR